MPNNDHSTKTTEYNNLVNINNNNTSDNRPQSDSVNITVSQNKYLKLKSIFSNKKQSPDTAGYDKPTFNVTSSSKINSHANSNATINKLNYLAKNCNCCGIILTYPPNVNRVKCMICNTYFTLSLTISTSKSNLCSPLPSPEDSTIHFHDISTPLASYKSLKSAIKHDEFIIKSYKTRSCDTNSESIHKLFKSVDALVEYSFSDSKFLNDCFILDSSKLSDYRSPNLNFNEITKFYQLLLNLPTKRPFYKLLTYSLYILKHPAHINDYNDIRWLLILMEIPMLYESLTGKNSLSTHFSDICYDITKRIIGLLSFLDHDTAKTLVRWWSRLPVKEFHFKIDFINLYITFHVNRLYTHVLCDQLGKKVSTNETEDDINFKSTLESRLSHNLNHNKDFLHFKNKPKITISFYSDCWHLRTACTLMSYLFLANKKHQKLDDSYFYNSLVDYINVTQDFDVWHFNNSFIEHEKNISSNPESLTGDYLLMEQNKSYLGISMKNGVYKISHFTICSYPFLISLGSKILILQHEAKRVMGLKAEQAFLSSIIDGKLGDIYFKLKVRRNFLALDSLKQIQDHPNDVRKLLKVEFINEQGIDAGGLKKEWFLLLTNELFDSSKGLITYNNENSLAYFSVSHKKDYKNELFYLLGVVIGMAIYNSIILDVKFPIVLYNKLLGHKISIRDLCEIEPTIANNLKKILKMKNAKKLNLNFEISIVDMYNKVETYDLIPNGSNIIVDDINKFDYVHYYCKFLLDDIVEQQFTQFSNGFQHVIGKNLLSLLTSSEIRKLITGDSDDNFDIEILRSVTKYSNCHNEDTIVVWFWEYFGNLATRQRRKLLRFITGTDRIPATGLANMQFKISKLIDTCTGNGFSERLPISHTCFNEICLWKYKDRLTLEEKMDLAIHESEGFGLQ